VQRTCVIMQPTYLPWSGYFNLAAKCDTFVFLDDVQLEKRSWQTRNRILVSGREFLLSVPLVKSAQTIKINETLVSDWASWCPKHLKTIELAYPSILLETGVIEILTKSFYASRKISEINVAIIRSFFKILGIDCETTLSSQLRCDGHRSQKLANIVRAVGADVYLSPEGSREYLEADDFSNRFGIELIFQKYTPSPYPQRKSENFVSHLSIIDVIGSNGVDFASSYIRRDE